MSDKPKEDKEKPKEEPQEGGPKPLPPGSDHAPEEHPGAENPVLD